MTTYDQNYVEHKAFFIVGQKAIIFNEQGKMLVLQRSEKAGNGGKWSLAGGALEKDEEPVKGIEREIEEETELKVSGLKPFAVLSYTDKEGDFTLILGYTCVAQNDKVVINWEHDDYKWVTKEEALQMDLGSHARFFIEQFTL